MNVRVRRMLAGLGAIAATLGLTVVAAGPASAAATATISRSLYLTDVSNGYADLPSAGPQHIYLEAGVYIWSETLTSAQTGPVEISRTISLAGGWYDWQCALYGTGDYPYMGDPNYYSFCYLDPDASGLTTAYLPDGHDEDYTLPAGTYDFSSSLDPQF